MEAERKAPEGQRTVASVSRALSIIELMAERESQEMSVSEVARELRIGRSTAHQLLRTLTAHGFVEQCEDSPRYRLGTTLMRTGAVAAVGRGLGPNVTFVLEDIVREVGETASIGIMAMREIVLLHRVEAHSVLRVDLRVGTRLPLLSSAIGQVILGAYPEATCDEIIREIELDTAGKQVARKKIEAARRQGYAIVRDTPVAGINAIAAAIKTPKLQPIAGLVVAGPSSRFEPERCSAMVVEKARALSELVDFKGTHNRVYGRG